MVCELTRVSRMRDQVFISYSHKDIAWIERFSTHLTVIQQTDRLVAWSDKRIQSGQNWQAEINDAIARSCVALLLASPDFFASAFIKNEEFPEILKRHRDKDLFLYWVPIKHAAYEKSWLADFQAASDPKQPLQGRSEAEQDRLMSEIALGIGEKLGQSVRVAGGARQNLRRRSETCSVTTTWKLLKKSAAVILQSSSKVSKECGNTL